MCRWFDVASVFELTSGARVVKVLDEAVVVFNLGGEYFAYKDSCPQDGAELSKCELVGDVIICPRHKSGFSIRTGAALGAPTSESLVAFPLRISQGKVQIEIELA